ncbi:uncharacterized protein LOC110034049 [Phalaenopsis equestris]|uniref:uncharacterized protein LOC110034049 n=1 Tax=Phalaenopsis equestris TaxID=78828 RepID=UPI0009E1B163|nr:uncharacterized protein LOC110034049 [Phalaenopsis equestris]XP_020593949.1 uncharacterized protein LOC110034049 [Phalaenopsis equestris]
MMLRSGDLNLNRPWQAFGDSTMERLKQAMLQHEFIFRNQVCELHRLYWTQKSLMNELLIKDVDTDAPRSYSWLIRDSEEKKNAFCMSSRAKEAGNVIDWKDFKGQSTDMLKNHPREFSLHLSADDFIRNKGKEPVFHHQASNLPLKEVIDLESSVELQFHEVRASMENCSGVFGTQASVPWAQVSSSIAGNFKTLMASVTHLSEEAGRKLREQKPTLPYVGVGDFCIEASVNQPRTKQQATPLLFDLNLPVEHESSHDLKGTLEQEKSNSCPAETSFIPKPPWPFAAAAAAAKLSCESRTSSLILHCEASKSNISIDLKLAHDTTDNKNDVVSGCQIQAECFEGSTDSCDQGFLSINALPISKLYIQEKDYVDSSTDKLRSSSNLTSSNSINLPQTANKDSVTKPNNNDGTEEDTSSSSSHAIAQDEIAPSRKFLTEFSAHEISRNNEFSNTDNSVTTQLNSSSQNEGSLMGKLKPEEWDTSIISAAEALMSFPQCSSDRSKLPQYSSDSFELMTLQLSEIQSEDRHVTIEPSNVNTTGKKEGGVRLRRGRGFRDFQKEILPGLVTLSRHEICEDLHNIGYKLRRVKSRKARDDWFVPVRSRISKLCSGRRRRFSSP